MQFATVGAASVAPMRQTAASAHRFVIGGLKRPVRNQRGRTIGECNSHVPIGRAGGKAVISCLAEGAIDGATLRGVEFRVVSVLQLAQDRTAGKYAVDTAL